MHEPRCRDSRLPVISHLRGLTSGWTIERLWLALILCGWIAPFVAWADRAVPGRGSARMRAWLLALGPLLVGVAIPLWRSGLFVLNSASPKRVALMATSTAAPLAPAFRPTTWWDVVQGDTTAATAPIVKAIHDDFSGAFAFLLGLGLPIAFIAYGAFVGGRAVRFFVEQDRSRAGG